MNSQNFTYFHPSSLLISSIKSAGCYLRHLHDTVTSLNESGREGFLRRIVTVTAFFLTQMINSVARTAHAGGLCMLRTVIELAAASCVCMYCRLIKMKNNELTIQNDHRDGTIDDEIVCEEERKAGVIKI